MFDTSSILRSIDIYLVENLVQSFVALTLVLGFVRWLRIREPALRIKLYLLVILVPLLAPPVYYLLFPGRSQMPVLKFDRFLALERIIPYQQDGSIWALALTMVLILTLGFLIARIALSVTALLLISTRHWSLPPQKDSSFQSTLTELAAKAGVRLPRVLLSESPHSSPGTFGLAKWSFLLLPTRWLAEGQQEPLQATLAHEIAHLKRGDHHLLPFVRLARGLLFFNPAVHIACAMIAHEAELASDREALELGVEPSAYGLGLVRAWQAGASSCIVKQPSGGKELKGRLEAVLTDHAITSGGPRWAFPALATTMGAAFFFLC